MHTPTVVGVTVALLLGAEAVVAPANAVTTPTHVTTSSDFTSRVVATGLSDPWEITVGPDGYLWTTERSTGHVVRVNPKDGSVHEALVVDEVVSAAADGMLTGVQQGLLGMALDPFLLKGKHRDYVYVAHSYDSDPSDAIERHTKIVRYTYDTKNQTLGSPVDLITGLPGGEDHQSGRLTMGPKDRKLYYTIGDQGANQSVTYCTHNEAQRLPTAPEVAAHDWSPYKGKVLRLNLDGTIPADNPVLAGVRSHVYAYGFRNAQGISFSPEGQLYTSEHGPKADDELNRIIPGGNYGWPNVSGYRDDKSYVYGDWSAATGGCSTLEYSDYVIPDAVPQQTETSFKNPAYVEPIRTFGTVPNGYDFQDPTNGCAPYIWFICWPTTAPASLDVYRTHAIPGWHGSLLVPSLKDGVVYQVPRTHRGRATGTPVPFFHTVNRYRDIAVSPDGRTVYIVTDSSGLTHDITGNTFSFTLDNPASILAYTYTPRRNQGTR